MTESIKIWLPDAEMTKFCGSSLRQTLYGPSTVVLEGELGAGKTTFLQGFARSLGVEEPLTSPTFALEQRYQTKSHGELLHIDCYRLTPAQARELVAATDDHPGIRCIEWGSRLEHAVPENAIHISLAEEKEGRTATITFCDMPLPSSDDIDVWRKSVLLPEVIIRHCNAVAAFSVRLGNLLIERGIIVRPLALQRAGELHDLLRVVDMRGGAGHAPLEVSEEMQKTWDSWKARYPGMRHEPAVASFLRSHGFDTLAAIIEVHGLTLPSPERTTIEQQILFYADKRVIVDRTVTLEERFEDFHNRYGKGEQSKEGAIWLAEAKEVESRLFPGGVPR